MLNLLVFLHANLLPILVKYLYLTKSLYIMVFSINQCLVPLIFLLMSAFIVLSPKKSNFSQKFVLNWFEK